MAGDSADVTADDAAGADTPAAAPVRYRTGLGTSDLESITLLGHDLADDLIGQITFGELAFWLMAKRRPTAGERTMFEAVLVALADHGFTPTAIAARLTLLSAPDSVQGALAAGLLGGGSRFLGVTENAARFLHDAIAALDVLPADDAGWDDVARELVSSTRATGSVISSARWPSSPAHRASRATPRTTPSGRSRSASTAPHTPAPLSGRGRPSTSACVRPIDAKSSRCGP